MGITTADWVDFNKHVDEGLKHLSTTFINDQEVDVANNPVWDQIAKEIELLGNLRQQEITSFEKTARRWRYLTITGSILTVILLLVTFLGNGGQFLGAIFEQYTLLNILGNAIETGAVLATIVTFCATCFFEWKKGKTLEKLEERKKLDDKDVLALQKLITVIRTIGELKTDPEEANIRKAFEALRELPPEIAHQSIPSRARWLTPLIEALPENHEVRQAVKEVQETQSDEVELHLAMEEDLARDSPYSGQGEFVGGGQMAVRRSSLPWEKDLQRKQAWSKLISKLGFEPGTFRVMHNGGLYTLTSPFEIQIDINDLSDIETEH